MVTVILKGGLGNQMFQYAFGKALALEKNEEMILDTSFLDTRLPVKDFTLRKYDLDMFGVNDTLQTTFRNTIFKEKLGYIFLKIKSAFNQEYLQEKTNPYAYEDDIYSLALQAKKPVLEGYFNNYQYFEKHKSEITKIFDMSKLYDQKFVEIEDQIKTNNSVSINIRRGDYLNSKHKDIFVQLNKEYYQKAIKIIRDKVRKPLFFVFSYDHPDWIKKELAFGIDELVIVGNEYVGERFKTYLRLISLCKHNIISNSTFAFWGAYLNKNKGKIVISPEKWMTNYNFENPKDWIALLNA